VIKATIMISSRNRPEGLRRALESVRRLDGYADIEVIVTDDASRVDIKELLGKDFPEVLFLRSNRSLGHIVHRNRMFRAAKGEYVFSLDDDARFMDNNAVNSALEVFSSNHRAAILNFRVRFPDGCSIPETTPCDGIYEVPEFIGCAHAIRRSCFVPDEDLYDALYFRQGEERDLAIKCMDRGNDILQVNRIVVFHDYEGEGRDHEAIHALAFRNELFFYLKFYPAAYCCFAVLKCAVSHAVYCSRRVWPRAYFSGITGFCRYFFEEIRKRSPVRAVTVRRYRALMRDRKRQTVRPDPRGGV